jgi:N-acetyl-anhydromuramyl-L-alanine amidase AmpD
MSPPGGLQPTPVAEPKAPDPGALVIDSAGVVQDPLVKAQISPAIEHGAMAHVNGIIVHQTGGATARSALDSYKRAGANGAHFLIDKDGTIYQTASVFKVTHHVGQLKSRCMAQMSCTATELKVLKGLHVGKPIGRVEAAKPWPDRYPGNADAIGIEMVGQAVPLTEPNPDKRVYEPLTEQQQQSFSWLLNGLTATLNVAMTEVFTHPTVSWKNASEGASAKW